MAGIMDVRERKQIGGADRLFEVGQVYAFAAHSLGAALGIEKKVRKRRLGHRRFVPGQRVHGSPAQTGSGNL